MNTVRIFISSPDDVEEERMRARRAVESLRIEFIGRVGVELLFWEDEPLTATKPFQHQIKRASEADIVVTILWSRLGTPLSTELRRADGSRYESGTVYEFEDAIGAAEKTGLPKVLVYQRTSPVVISLDAPDLEERRKQRRDLEDYVAKWFGQDADGAARRAIRKFDAPQEFAEMLEEHLRRQIQQFVRETQEPEPTTVAWKGSPFRGLEAFEFEHAPIFCGRDAAIAQIEEALHAREAEGCAFVLILGMSGGGKSSVVRAGVIPKLTRTVAASGRELRRAIYRPGSSGQDLMNALGTALCAEHAVPQLAAGDHAADTFVDLIRSSPGAAAAVLIRALRAKREHLVLLLDQLEQVFSPDGPNEEQRAALFGFMELLAVSGAVWVIATLRSDFYAQAAADPVIRRLKFGKGQLDLQPPTAAEISQMIRFPAHAAGLRFEERDGSRLDDVLRDKAGESSRALPLLEFTLEQLYARSHHDGLLRFATYEALGGLEGSVATKADETLAALPAGSQNALGRVLSNLGAVDFKNTDRLIRRELTRRTFAADPDALALINAFVEARLFVSGADVEGQQVIEIAHEALLSEWEKARTWFQRNADLVRIHSRVAMAAALWQREERSPDRLAFEGRPLNDARILLQHAAAHEIRLEPAETEFVEASVAQFVRQVRRKRIALTTFATTALVATIFGAVAWFWRGQAREDAATAQSSIDFLVGMFERVSPRYALGQDVTVREVLEEARENVRQRLEKRPRVLARVLRAVGEVYASTANSDEAIALLEEVIKRQETLDVDWEQDAAAHLALADAYYLAQRDADAETEYSTAEKIARSGEPDGSEVLADSLIGLADVTEDLDVALARYKEAENIHTALFGPADARTLRARKGIASVYTEDKQYPKAIELLEELRQQMVKTAGTEASPEVAEISEILARALWESGDTQAARSFYGEVLSTYATVYAADDPEVANALTNVARLEIEQCEVDPAAEKLNRSLDIQKKRITLPRPLAAYANYNLGLILLSKGDVAGAESHFNATRAVVAAYLAEITSTEKKKGNELSTTEVEERASADMLVAEASALIGLAETRTARGDFAGAGAALDRAKEIYTALGTDEKNWRFGVLQNAQALLLARTQRAKDATELLQNSLSTFTARWPKGSFFSAITTERLREISAQSIGAETVGCPSPSNSQPAESRS